MWAKSGEAEGPSTYKGRSDESDIEGLSFVFSETLNPGEFREGGNAGEDRISSHWLRNRYAALT